jgi:hypothetical protein
VIELRGFDTLGSRFPKTSPNWPHDNGQRSSVGESAKTAAASLHLAPSRRSHRVRDPRLERADTLRIALVGVPLLDPFLRDAPMSTRSLM